MRLAKASANLLAVLAMTLCVIPGSWAQAKPHKKKMAPKAKAAAAAKPAPAATPAPEAPAATTIESANKRDPFIPLVTDKKDVGELHLPPGKAGLVIATVRVSGTVQAAGGMIAVVSNPEERVYFIKEGDRLYDGDVEKISLDGVTFKENTKDAFGKPVERVVTKRIYASAGEQQ
jgi:Tfp pilus assembly protein PilP